MWDVEERQRWADWKLWIWWGSVQATSCNMHVPTSNSPYKGQIWVLLLALSLVLTPFNPLLWPSSLIQDPATKDAVA